MQDTPTNKYAFAQYLEKSAVSKRPHKIETLQVNITKLCNQACLHCHVDASPKRKEMMSLENIQLCIEILKTNSQIRNLDITGGAPELNPHFDYLVVNARELDRHVIVRHNLTVTFDGNPQTAESKQYLPQFFATNEVEVISSLPYYQEYFTDKQRGRGVFEKSISAIRLLNEQGYGHINSGLELNLVYNPVGAFLPASQVELENQYKKELLQKHDIYFNKLYTITNMPIHRFRKQLLGLDQYESYMEKLVNAFNPHAAENLMCKSLISVSYDGSVYDCDFNQMLDMKLKNNPKLADFNLEELKNREILFADHCYGCTAGSGSSCGGVIAENND